MRLCWGKSRVREWHRARLFKPQGELIQADTSITCSTSSNVLNLHDWVPKLWYVQILSLWELAPWQHSQCFLCSFLMDWPQAPGASSCSVDIHVVHEEENFFCPAVLWVPESRPQSWLCPEYWAVPKGKVRSTQKKITYWQRTAYETRCSVCFKRLKGRVYVLRTFYFFFSFYNLEEHVFTKSLCQRWR